MEVQPKPPPTVFLSYAQKDEKLKQEFEDYLIIWQQSQLIAGWVERQVQRGTDWSQTIDPRLFDAYFVWTSSSRLSKKAIDPLRQEIIEQAQALS